MSENLLRQRHKEGERVRSEVLGAGYASEKKDDPFYRHFYEFTIDHCWGSVWLRSGLDRKTRSMLNLAMLAAMGRWSEREMHTLGALNNGVSEAEIAEVLLQAGVYAGVPVAAEGFRTAFRVIESWRQSSKPASESGR